MPSGDGLRSAAAWVQCRALEGGLFMMFATIGSKLSSMLRMVGVAATLSLAATAADAVTIGGFVAGDLIEQGTVALTGTGPNPNAVFVNANTLSSASGGSFDGTLLITGDGSLPGHTVFFTYEDINGPVFSFVSTSAIETDGATSTYLLNVTPIGPVIATLTGGLIVTDDPNLSGDEVIATGAAVLSIYEAAVVPLPAGVFLLIGGLGTLVVLRRRSAAA
jgi:hypothetical protein